MIALLIGLLILLLIALLVGLLFLLLVVPLVLRWIALSVLLLVALLVLLWIILSVLVTVAIPIVLLIAFPILLPVLTTIPWVPVPGRVHLALVWIGWIIRPAGPVRAWPAFLRFARGGLRGRYIVWHAVPVLVAHAEGLRVAQTGCGFLLCPLADAVGILQLGLILRLCPCPQLQLL